MNIHQVFEYLEYWWLLTAAPYHRSFQHNLLERSQPEKVQNGNNTVNIAKN